MRRERPARRRRNSARRDTRRVRRSSSLFPRTDRARFYLPRLEGLEPRHLLAVAADIVDVSPDPRNDAAGIVAVSFNEDVSGVDLSDFRLQRGTTDVSLNGIAFTQITPDQYTLDLSAVTSALGSYTLTLDAAASDIQNGSGETLADDASDTFLVTGGPVAIDDDYWSEANEPITTTLGVDDLLINDSNPMAGLLSVNPVPEIDAAGGDLVLGADGTFTYTPGPNFSGTDSFTYELLSDGVTADTGVVEIHVYPPAVVPTSPIQLFDGTTFNGLYASYSDRSSLPPGVGDFAPEFGIAQNHIVAAGMNEAALVTEDRYRDYVMVLEFKWGDENHGNRSAKRRTVEWWCTATARTSAGTTASSRATKFS